MRKTTLIIAAMLLAASILSAREDRNLLQGLYNAIENKTEVFKTGGDWFPYPAYTDREGWDRLTVDHKKALVKNGEKFLRYRWQYTPAYSYLEFEKDGNREHGATFADNNEALCGLLLAELAEGKGRFIPQLINGMYFWSMSPTWNAHPHTGRDRVTNRNLPNPDVRFIALEGARLGGLFALTLHMFEKEFDKYDPMISKIAYKALERNIFEPYLNEWNYTHGHEWLGFDRVKGKRVGNWNTFCNTFTIFCFLLCAKDQADLEAALKLCTWSMDQYLEALGLDGACDEGPSYWNMAGGKVYDFARMMYDASEGKFNMFTDDQIRRIGEWKSKTHIGDGWVIPFGDGEAHNWGDKEVLFRFGEDIGSQELKNFSLYLLADVKNEKFKISTYFKYDPYRILETLRYQEKMRGEQQAAVEAAGGDFEKMMVNLRKSVTSEWYPDTEHAALRTNNLWFLGAKGGHNNECHNHNDVGSGVFFIEYCPVLIDPGCGTYGKNTFGPNRYKQWNVRSEWHNLPIINGTVQEEGREFASKGSQCDVKKNMFSTDISGAYPEEAGCKGWHRTYKLTSKELTITDNYSLQERTGENAECFITHGRPYLPCEEVKGYVVKNGEVVIEARNFAGDRNVYVRMVYPKELEATVEKKIHDDKRMIKVWKGCIYRLKFTASAAAPLAGTYTFKLNRLYL